MVKSGKGTGAAMGGKRGKGRGAGREVDEVDIPSSDGEEWQDNRGGKGGRGGYGDDSDEEVFDLSAQHDDDEEESMSESDNYDDSASEDEDGDNDHTDLDHLVDNLPSDIRQKVLRGRVDELDEDSDESENDDDAGNSGWGKKSNYYSGDTADLEIGQDEADAEDEELAVHELRKEQLSKRSEQDYETSSEEEEESQSSKQLTQQLEKISRSQGNTLIERLDRDLSKLTKKQRMDILTAECPEMLGLVDELNEKITDLRQRIEPVKRIVEKLSNYAPVEDELVKYLQVKQQILLSYCINILFYLMLKAEGASVQSHPVMKQLLKLRYIMERMRHLDGKMKHQIDRLLSTPEDVSFSASAPTSSRPNINALLDAAEEDEEESEEEKKVKSKSTVYRAPKIHAVPYNDDKDISQLEDKIKRKKNKIRNSEILDALREEFGQAPEESSSSGLGKLTKEQQVIDDEIEERRKFEEDRFVRLTLSKKDKKAIKKRREMTLNPTQELVADMGDIDDLESLSILTSNLHSSDPSLSATKESSMDRLKTSGSLNSESLSNALKKAVTVFSEIDKKKPRGGDEEDFSAGQRKIPKSQFTQESFNEMDENYSDDGLALGGIPPSALAALAQEGSSKKRRRRAPEADQGEFDDDHNLFSEFSRKKKEFLNRKKDHYAVELRTGGHEDILEDPADKRAATYEIMTNRGLRPHRKKSNRNPRVKKREAFDKAVQKRKSQVREVVSGSTVAYGGEMTGIKANLSRSRRF